MCDDPDCEVCRRTDGSPEAHAIVDQYRHDLVETALAINKLCYDMRKAKYQGRGLEGLTLSAEACFRTFTAIVKTLPADIRMSVMPDAMKDLVTACTGHTPEVTIAKGGKPIDQGDEIDKMIQAHTAGSNPNRRLN